MGLRRAALVASSRTRRQDDLDYLEFKAPNAERVYQNYLETCKRLGVEPVLVENAQHLLAEWSKAIARSGSVPPLTHSARHVEEEPAARARTPLGVGTTYLAADRYSEFV